MFFLHFCNLTERSLSASEFKRFFIRRMRWKATSMKTTIFGFFWKMYMVFPKLCRISETVERFINLWIVRTQISNWITGTFAQLWNLIWKLASSMTSGSWFTYRALSPQNSTSVEFVLILYFQFIGLKRFGFGSQDMQQSPIPYLLMFYPQL